MFLSALQCAFRRTLALVLAGTLTAMSWAQTATQPAAALPDGPRPQRLAVTDYSKPNSHFPNPLGPYMARHLPPADLLNTPRIEQLLRDGKLYLSMNDAVALALENNLDIAISRYNLNIADTDVLRANAGAQHAGREPGLLQGTPGGNAGGLGGTIGSGPGGTSVSGTGGAGGGASGLVISTLGSGPQITSFDPVVTGALQFDHTISCPPVLSPSPITIQNTTTANFTYLQGFKWGSDLQVGFNNSRSTTDSTSPRYSPTLGSNFQARFTQHLLQGFGFAPNTRFIRSPRITARFPTWPSGCKLLPPWTRSKTSIGTWCIAYENVRVQNESLTFAQKTLSDTQKQVEIGTLAPIEVVRAQSTVATDQQQLTLAQTNLQLQQLLMKNALSRTLVDPRLADAEVIPTSTMHLPDQEPVVPTQDLVNEALSHRAELAEARINLKTRRSAKVGAQFTAALPGSLRLLRRIGHWGRQNGMPTCARRPCRQLRSP